MLYPPPFIRHVVGTSKTLSFDLAHVGIIDKELQVMLLATIKLLVFQGLVILDIWQP